MPCILTFEVQWLVAATTWGGQAWEAFCPIHNSSINQTKVTNRKKCSAQTVNNYTLENLAPTIPLSPSFPHPKLHPSLGKCLFPIFDQCSPFLDMLWQL